MAIKSPRNSAADFSNAGHLFGIPTSKENLDLKPVKYFTIVCNRERAADEYQILCFDEPKIGIRRQYFLYFRQCFRPAHEPTFVPQVRSTMVGYGPVSHMQQQLG